MCPRVILNDGIQQKLVGTIENILQVDINISSHDLSLRLKDVINKRTKDEQSQIDIVAGILHDTADHLVSKIDGHFSSPNSRFSSSKSITPQIQKELAGIIEKILQIEMSIWSNDLFRRLQDIIPKRTNDEQSRIKIFAKILDHTFNAEPEPTTEGVTTDYDRPRIILVERDSEHNTGDAHTGILEYSRGKTGEADDDITTDSQTDDSLTPACGYSGDDKM